MGEVNMSIGGIIFVGAVLGAIALVAGIFFWRRRKKIRDDVIEKVRR